MEIGLKDQLNGFPNPKELQLHKEEEERGHEGSPLSCINGLVRMLTKVVGLHCGSAHLLNKIFTVSTDVINSVLVDGEICFKSFMLLQ